MRLRLSTVVFAFWVAAAQAQSVSLTFDDGLNPDEVPAAREWNGQILDSLKQADVRAMVFPSLRSVGHGAGRELIAAWSEGGHGVGNHTSKHRSLSSSRVSLSDFIEDVREADQAFRGLASWEPRLRFPFLKEGNTESKRDGIRKWMRDNNYLAAPVSVDTSDWYYNQVFLELVRLGDQARVAKLQEQYVAHLLDRAQYYDQLAVRVLGRSPKHVLLLHVSAINAATLNLVIGAFRQRGWRLVSPAEAFADPLYHEAPD
ncbi:MAG: polysaccharide deacetylase family protein, partial [Gammaproteobacteria bacterium]